jgi:hypothetical protein
LPEVRSQAQALKLGSTIVFRISHGPPKPEVSGRTPTLPLSVVQTTEPKPRQGNWLERGAK